MTDAPETMAGAPLADIVPDYCDPGGYKPRGVIGIAFDVETTGGCMTVNAMTEVGAVAMAVEDYEQRRVLARFEGHMKIPEGCGFEERCEKEFWDVHKVEGKQRALGCQKEPQDVMRAFVDWVSEVRVRYAGGEARRVRFLSDAVYFDAAWMSHYLTKYASHYPMHTFFSEPSKSRFKPVIDTNAFFRGVANVDLSGELAVELGPEGRFSSSKAARSALSIPEGEKPDVEHDHRAVHDAESIMKEYLIVTRYLRGRARGPSILPGPQLMDN